MMSKKHLKILLVDEPNFRKRLARELSASYGHEVMEGDDYEQAMGLVTERPGSFDLAIVDYSLEGGRSGVELLKALHQVEPYLPVIIITGVGDRKISQEALQAGAFWYLDKPHDSVELEMLLKWAGRYRATSQQVNPQSVWGANLWMPASNAIVSAQTIPELIEAVRSKARRLLETERCGLLEVDPETGLISGWSTAEGKEQEALVEIFSPLARDMTMLEKPYLASDADTDASTSPFLAWAACACPPDKGATEILFALFEKELTEEQKLSLELKLVALARLIGVALENLRRAKLLEALVDSGKELLTVRNEKQVYRILEKQILEKLKVKTFYLAIHRRSTDIIDFPFFFHQGEEIGDRKPTLNRKEVGEHQSFTVFVVNRNEELTIEDVNNHPYPTKAYQISGTSAKAYFAVPLRRPDGSAFGVLSIQSAVPRSFPEPLKQGVRAFASLLAPTLNRLRRSRLRERILEELMDGDPQSVLQESLNSIWESVNADLVRFYPYDPKRKTFRLDQAQTSPQPSEAPPPTEDEIPTLYRVLQLGDHFTKEAVLDHVFGPLWTERYGTQSIAGIVLKPSGSKSPSGVIIVHYKDCHVLDDELQTDINLFSQFTAVASHLVEQQEQQQRAEEQRQLLETLGDVTDRSELARIIGEMVPTFWSSPLTCRLLLADRGERKLFDPLLDAPQIAYGEGLVGEVAQSGDFLLAQDAEALLTFKPLLPETQSALSVPVKLGGSLLGVVSLESPAEGVFEEEDRLFLDELAKAAAPTLVAASRKAATEMVTDAARRALLDPERGLEIVAESVHNIVTSVGGAPTSTTVFLVTREKELELAWAWPADQRDGLWKTVGTLPLEEAPGRKLGIVARAALDKRTQFVSDIHDREDYIAFDKKTLAELAVPVLATNNTVIGVINVEYSRPGDLADVQESLLQTLVEQTEVIAVLQNQARELSLHKRTLAEKGQEKAIAETLAFAGLQFTELAHRLGGMVMLIKGIEDEGTRIKELWDALKETSVWSSEHTQKMDSSIKFLMTFANRAAKSIESDLHDEKNPETTEVIAAKEWLENFAAGWSSNTVDLKTDIDAADSSRITVNRYWLKRGVENILKNSENALRGIRQPELRLEATIFGRSLLIIIKDNGPGMPDEIRNRLFVERIPGRGPGHGIGCLMTSFIVSFYKGDIFSLETSPRGTRIMIRLPLATSEIQ